MNIAHLCGFLANDVDLLRFEETSLCKFTLAVGHGDRVIFMPVEIWNQDHIAKCLRKGSRALVSGSLKENQWENDDGEKRSRIVLNAHMVEFLDNRGNTENPRSAQSGRENSRKDEKRQPRRATRPMANAG